MARKSSIFNPALPAEGGGNSERLARCRKVVDSLVTAGIAVAASGIATVVLLG